MGKARIILADDHRLVAEGLKALLEPEYELARIVADGRALVEAADELRPDVVVADVSMPLLNGIEAVRRLRRRHPRLVAVFLTMHTDAAYAAEAFEAGALGYVLKHSAPSELLTAIDSALKGRRYVSPALAERLDDYRFAHPRPRPADGLARLTARQREVLQLLAEGLSAKKAAAILGISARTVEFHKYGMMEVLGLKTSAELVRFAVERGIR